jgi:hypothetical protein
MPTGPVKPSQVKQGDTFNGWTVIGPLRREMPSRRLWCLAKCQCGTVKEVSLYPIVYGDSKNCGCTRKLAVSAAHRTHGKSRTRLYRIWTGMVSRCYKDTNEAYPNYGGRGIAVCVEWRDNFEAFERWATANGYAEDLEIDRRDNHGNYDPGNCRFVTSRVNQNNRRDSVRITAFEETKTLAEWARDYRCVVSYSLLRHRVVVRRQQAEVAITSPAQHFSIYRKSV